MNRENVTKLRDHMRSLADSGQEQRFNWSYWVAWLGRGKGREPFLDEIVNECGTAACVAGWAVALMGKNRVLDQNGYMAAASEILGLDLESARRMFLPGYASCYGGLHESWYGYHHHMPPGGVALMLDNLLETGEVDWSVVGPLRCFDEEGNEVSE